MQGMTAYGADLAGIHHRDFGWAATGAAEVLLQRLKRDGGRLGHAPVVDLGAGSGILARLLTQAGHRVIGVDISEDMLAIARREASEADFVRASVVDFQLPPCKAVTAIGEVLQYEFDGKRSLGSLQQTFERVHDALVPGGYFLFDLSGPGRGGPTGTIEKWHDHEDYTLFFRATENIHARSLVREQIVFMREGDHYRRVDERHVLSLFDPSDVEDLLRNSGFEAERLDRYPGGTELVAWNVFLARPAKS